MNPPAIKYLQATYYDIMYGGKSLQEVFHDHTACNLDLMLSFK